MSRSKFVLAPVLAGASFAIASGAYATLAPAPSTAPGVIPVVAPSAEAQKLGVVRTAMADLKSQGPTFGYSTPTLANASTRTRPLALQATRFTDNRSVWLSAEANKLCVYFAFRGADGPGGGCETADNVVAAGTNTSAVYSDTDIDFAGLVPDGVSKVNLALHDGSQVTATVENNAYAVHLKSLPASLSFSNSNGGSTTQKLFPKSTLG